MKGNLLIANMGWKEEEGRADLEECKLGEVKGLCGESEGQGKV